MYRHHFCVIGLVDLLFTCTICYLLLSLQVWLPTTTAYAPSAISVWKAWSPPCARRDGCAIRQVLPQSQTVLCVAKGIIVLTILLVPTNPASTLRVFRVARGMSVRRDRPWKRSVPLAIIVTPRRARLQFVPLDTTVRPAQTYQICVKTHTTAKKVVT